MGTEKITVRSYLNETLYDQLKEVSQVLDISMSRCIAECLMQGLEVIVAEYAGRHPNVVSKSMKKYMEEKNIKFPNENGG